MKYDVIIVGARCAGATLGALLARDGVRTLMLDAQPMPSDQPLSTHFIQAPGMGVLDSIGVGDAIRACTPPTRRIRLQVEEHAFWVDRTAKHLVPHVCRRSTVDPLLQQAALAAGSELRDRTRVTDLVREGGRVVGVVVDSPSGRETLRADLIVGADGRNSTIARLTGVEEYCRHPLTRSNYLLYFPTPRIWREDPRYADCDAYMGYRGDDLRYVFQCNGDLLVMLAQPPVGVMQGWMQDLHAGALAYFRDDPFIAPLVDASAPTGKGVGLLKAHVFFRRPVGAGFALIGDAGYFQDPVAGYGMSDAFIGARMLHAAILDGNEAAYERFWRQRDAESLPMFLEALRIGEVGFNDSFCRFLYQKLASRPDWWHRFAEMWDRERAPLDAFTPAELEAMLGEAQTSGRQDVVDDFMKVAARMGVVREQIQARCDLLAACH